MPAAKATARAAAVRKNTSPTVVRYATTSHAFLNRGLADGLQPGMEVSIYRRGRVAATCKVAVLAQHTASCEGGGAQAGDTFRMEKVTPPPEPAPRPPVASPAQVAAWHNAVTQGSFEKAEFVEPPRAGFAGAGFSADVALTHRIWATAPEQDRTFQSEQVDVSIRGADLTHGLKLFVDLSAVLWTQRPATFHLPQVSSAQLYVRETEVTRRESGPLVASAGRLWPVNAPGVGVIDGIQAGYRFGFGLEAGIFGGEIPNPIDLNFDFNRWTAGAYFAWERAGGPDSVLSFVRQTGRISFITEAETGARTEAETQLQARLFGAMEAVGDVRAGLGGRTGDPNYSSLEAAQIEVSAKAGDVLRFSGGVRYAGYQPSDVTAYGETASYEHRGIHADASVGLIGDAVTFTGIGGYFDDLDSNLTRMEAGPQLGLPHFFGNAGGLNIGYMIEYGWLGMQNGYIQAYLHPSPRWRLLLRGSYLQDAPMGQQATGTLNQAPVREIGAATNFEVSINKYVYVRLSGAWQRQLEGDFGGGPYATRTGGLSGFTASGTLGGRL